MRVEVKLQRSQLALGERRSVFGQIIIALGNATENGHGDERQHAGDRVSQPLLAPELWDLSVQTRHQTGNLSGFGRAARSEFAQHTSPSRRQLPSPQFHTRVFDQFAHPDLFGLIVLLIEVHRTALPPTCVSQLAPATDLVSGAAILLAVRR